MRLPVRPKQSSHAGSRWGDDMVEAARAGRTVRIACRQEDHRALRQEADRIGRTEHQEYRQRLRQLVLAAG